MSNVKHSDLERILKNTDTIAHRTQGTLSQDDSDVENDLHPWDYDERKQPYSVP
jgi:hypothetical protein